MARPTSLTPEIQEIVLSGIKAGMYYEDAANLAGISYHTLNNWRKRGKAELERRENPNVKEGTSQWDREQPFVEFFTAIKKAEGEALKGWLENIDKASKEQWQAAAWKAERRYPERYGRRVVDADVTSKGERVSIAVVNVDTDKL